MNYRTVATRLPLKLVHAALVLSLAFAASAFSHTAAAANKKLPEESPEGLKLLPNTKVSAVYMREGADFGGYDKVAILDCEVAFKKNWQRDINSGRASRVSDSDVTRIRTNLAEEFRKVFSQQLTDHGQTVVSTGGTGVLVLRPAIINLDITAPDNRDPTVRTYSASAGEATLFLELYDGVSGELLARVLDVEEAHDMGTVRVRNSVTNKADADRMLKKWADLLGNYLQKARAGEAPTAAK